MAWVIEEMNREKIVDYILDCNDEQLKELKTQYNARSDFELVEKIQQVFLEKVLISEEK